MTFRVFFALCLALVFFGCGGGSGGDSSSSTSTTVCSDVSGVTVPDAQEIVNDAVDNSVPTSSDTPDVVVVNPTPTETPVLGGTIWGGNTTTASKGNGVVVVTCGGTFIDTETNNVNPTSSAQKKEKILAAIHSGAVSSLVVR